MRCKIASSLGCLVTVWLASFCAVAQEKNGRIVGVVVDEHGRPVAEALVSVQLSEPNRVEVWGAAPIYTATDAEGRFKYLGLEPNLHYKVYAKKESDFYPDEIVGLDSKRDRAPRVMATTSLGPKPVKVRIGPKAARLTWTISDAVTGGYVNNPTVSLKCLGRGEIGGNIPGDKGHLVPSKTAVMVEVSAPGYRTWYYPGTSDEKKRKGVKLAPASERTLDIKLEPEGKWVAGGGV